MSKSFEGLSKTLNSSTCSTYFPGHFIFLLPTTTASIVNVSLLVPQLHYNIVILSAIVTCYTCVQFNRPLNHIDQSILPTRNTSTTLFQQHNNKKIGGSTVPFSPSVKSLLFYLIILLWGLRHHAAMCYCITRNI